MDCAITRTKTIVLSDSKTKHIIIIIITRGRRRHACVTLLMPPCTQYYCGAFTFTRHGIWHAVLIETTFCSRTVRATSDIATKTNVPVSFAWVQLRRGPTATVPEIRTCRSIVLKNPCDRRTRSTRVTVRTWELLPGRTREEFSVSFPPLLPILSENPSWNRQRVFAREV